MKHIKKLFCFLLKNFYHIIELTGFVLVLFSLYQIYKPLAGIVVGALLIVIGLSSPHVKGK